MMLQTFLGNIMLSKIEFDIKLGHRTSNVLDVTHYPPVDWNIERRRGISTGRKPIMASPTIVYCHLDPAGPMAYNPVLVYVAQNATSMAPSPSAQNSTEQRSFSRFQNSRNVKIAVTSLIPKRLERLEPLER